MISKKINFSTGPVALHYKVKEALIEDPIPHRCEEFQTLKEEMTSLYKDEFNVRDVYFLTGSGTTANEAMIQQIKMLNKPGLILSNGEFGNRLINQATTNDLDFLVYHKTYGERFLESDIEELIIKSDISWILFTHCETSTGIINNLGCISRLCKLHNVLCFADCISSVAAFRIDLSNVAMVTASSGKGLCGIAGIAIVLSNIKPSTNKKISSCLDLTNYVSTKVPFTISSNIMKALYTGSILKLNSESYDRISNASKQLSTILEREKLKTFNAHSHVFTIISAYSDETKWLANDLLHHGLIPSYKSEYLQKNNWLQIALFGIFSDEEMHEGVNRIKSSLSCRVLS